MEVNAFLKSFHPNILEINRLNASGSGRINYKIKTEEGTYIYTENNNIAENESFFYLTELFQNLNVHVPKIIKINPDKTAYIQTYVGDQTLLEAKIEGKDTNSLYRKSIIQLANLQIAAAELIDKTQLYDSKKFDTPLVYRDLFYFKNYFLDFTDITYLQSDLLNEFEYLANKIKHSNFTYLMLRDFQGRNIMVNDETPYFIDYQDSMLGPMAYDLVSLLWQAKANLSTEEKEEYYRVYTNQIKKLIPQKFEENQFLLDYQHCLIIRLLQVLGAYGKLGLIQGKPHFKESIQLGIRNLKSIKEKNFMFNFPTLQKIIADLKVDDIPKIL